MRFIYVLAHDGGCEGYSAPIQAFTDASEARAAQVLANQGEIGSYKLFRVPVCPEKADDYLNIKATE